MWLPNSINRTNNYFGKSNSSGDGYLQAKMSDVRLWKVARSQQEIEDSMYLQLAGTEVGLEGYWRLGAIVEGKERKVVDFSTNGNDGSVYGGAFVNAVTLPRTLKDGKQAVKYANDELFAVTQRATYVESFEFKTNPQVDPNNADGAKNKIFQFFCWGKNNRSSEQRVDIQGQAIDFKNLENGWYQASYRFTVPDDINLVRSFGIANVKGTWETLEIRKHQIVLESEAVTEVKYADSVTLTTLADNQAQLSEKLEQMRLKESEEAALLEDKNDCEAKLAALSNLEETRKTVEALNSNVKNLESEVATLESKYKQEVESPLNYWCQIYSVDTKRHIAPWKRSDYYYVRADDSDLKKTPDDYLFKFEEQSNGYYSIFNKGKNTELRPTTENNSNVLAINTNRDKIPDYFHWEFKQIKPYNEQHYLIRNIGKRAYIAPYRDKDYNVRADIPIPQPGLQTYACTWKLKKTKDTTNNKIDEAKEALDLKRQELTTSQEELEPLQTALNADDDQKKDWENRLQQVNTQLSQVQTQLNTLNTDLLNGIKNTYQTPQTLPQVAKDDKNLLTKGALLGFVRPTSRLTAIETCEGNVQLSYFDDSGTMRLTNFDATSDSQNSTFEQWIPDALRPCLNLQQNNSAVIVDNTIPLADEYTIEAWFFYPLPKTAVWNTLVGAKDTTDHHIVVYQGKQLGTLVNGLFSDSGYNLEGLSSGWHHLTVVGRGKGEKATSSFYIDGEQVGQVQTRTALKFDGQDDEVNCGSKINLANASFTVEFWAKRDAIGKNQYVFSQGSGTTNQGLGVGWQDNNQFFFAFHGNDLYTPNTYTDTEWHHWACVYDSNTKKRIIYQDGEKVAEDTATENYQGTGELLIAAISGTTRFQGEIQEARIWKRTRTQQEIRADFGKTLTSKETDLVGYWRFAKNSAKDYSSNAAPATLSGNPETVTLPAQSSKDIYTIGNAQNGSQQFGKLAEVRIWQIPLSEEEIQVNSKTLLTGNEPGLFAYYPMIEATGTDVRDYTGNQYSGKIQNAIWWGAAPPIGTVKTIGTVKITGDAVVSSEYSTVGLDPSTGQKIAIMRRLFAYPTADGVTVLPDKRIEQLELKWIGNAQFAPTLLGYIEGPPPVPSENLTVSENYNGATSVELTMSDDVNFSWNRAQEAGL